ncbi:uncharacterized protein (DUF1778 family) [Neorhizobium sp. 2083]|uniref:type II toxin-antitoxin system TacA family antitoxin n=1 Tax=Neorhizobium sp. 2083 TaxID=2817762 RepID=UPI0028652945|nr:DUF1778 domain-containing protein [Neorhizobium sp. 2083]MDR6815266.1 uncharacterized protein (DUF1778 family) [Neorhizobium sp. 2083]
MVALRKSETINLRIDAGTREVIARAAEISGKSLTAFMTEAALLNAQKELLDQRFIGVDATVFDAVESLLAEPAQANEKLSALLKSSREWLD